MTARFCLSDAGLLKQTRLCDISVGSFPSVMVFSSNCPECGTEVSLVTDGRLFWWVGGWGGKQGRRDQTEECDSRQRKMVLHGR